MLNDDTTILPFLFSGFLFTLTAIVAFVWHKRLPEEQKKNLHNTAYVILVLGLLFLWGKTSIYSYELYSDSSFLSDESYPYTGKASKTYLNQYLLQDSPTCKAIQSKREFETVYVENGMSYCYFLKDSTRLYPYRSDGQTTQVLVSNLPWSDLLDIQGNLFKD